MNRLLLSSILASSLALGGSATTATRRAATDEEILVGQHVIYSWPDSAAVPDELTELVSAGLVGGVILFGENYDENTPDAMAALQEAYASSPAPDVLKQATGSTGPLLIMTDQEGGMVKRIKDGGPNMSAKEVGESEDPAAAGKQTGEEAAETLVRYNHNVNLAPVMDVYRVAGDFEDANERSYGNTSELVKTAGVPFVTAQQGGGVAACAKHFPGLGPAPTDANTDERPVTLNTSLSDLRSIDEAAFAGAVDGGIDLVMTSWAVYPSLDPDFPAGISSKWVQGELRDRLGFTGVTVTDAIEAGGLEAFGDDDNRAKLATQAGIDLILAAARNVTQGDSIRTSLLKELQKGSLDKAEFDAATKRIAQLKAKLA